jgi:two-component system CheB/CheR fusion protein
MRSEEARWSHLLNLDIGLRMDQLAQPIRDVLAGRTVEFSEVYEATNRCGRKILCRVTVTPMVQFGERPIGAVVLMEEVERPRES